MKTYLSITFLQICILSAPLIAVAQDMIYLRSGEKIEAKIEEVSKLDIKYKEYNYLDGPIHVINPATVYMIRYKSGTEEFFQPDPRDPVEKKWVSRNNFYKNGCNKYFASFAVGHGPSYGWIGIRYQGRIGKEIGFGWHAGGGIFPNLGMLAIDRSHFLYSGGLKFFFYRGMYVDLQYGTFMVIKDNRYYNYDYSSSYRYEPKDVILHGPSMTCGGDWFFNKYIGINAAVGFSYDVQQVRSGPHIFPALEWGVICKW
ncbi:MAG: hypothetical protein IH596_00350 [Bacteroidales bacterium]|nr:hypothetical protein [Bacteroidales bacterium]